MGFELVFTDNVGFCYALFKYSINIPPTLESELYTADKTNTFLLRL